MIPVGERHNLGIRGEGLGGYSTVARRYHLWRYAHLR